MPVVVRSPAGDILGELKDEYLDLFRQTGLVVDGGIDLLGFTWVKPAPRLTLLTDLGSLIASGVLNKPEGAREAYLRVADIFDIFEAQIRASAPRVYNA
jgi:hypothetical protein